MKCFELSYSICISQMEVVEEKQHEGIQQYYVTKIEELQVDKPFESCPIHFHLSV